MSRDPFLRGRVPGLPWTPPRESIRLPAIPLELVPEARPVPPPPPQQQPPTLGVASSYEAIVREVDWPRIATEASVYTTSRRWRACDVFVAFDPALSSLYDITLSVFVYGLSSGSRTLVASGRLRTGALHPARDAQWIVAARAVAERYEVTVRYDGSTLVPTIPGQLRVTVAASDEMTEPPPGLGEIVTLSSQGVKFYAVQRSVPPYLEVVRVIGSNDAAAARFLQLFDSVEPNFATLADPIMEWGIGAAAGAVVVDTPRYRATYAPALAVSSTGGGVYTPVASGGVTLVVR